MGEILRFGAKQKNEVDEPIKTVDIEEGVDKLVDYLACNCSIEVGMAILDITKEITDAARSEGYTIGSGSWFKVLRKVVDGNIISEEVYTKILGIYLELAGGNVDEAE